MAGDVSLRTIASFTDARLVRICKWFKGFDRKKHNMNSPQ